MDKSNLERLEVYPKGEVKITYDWGGNRHTFFSGDMQVIRKRIHAKKILEITTGGNKQMADDLHDFYNRHYGSYSPFLFTYDDKDEICVFYEALQAEECIEVGKSVGYKVTLQLEVLYDETIPEPADADDICPLNPYGNVIVGDNWNTNVLDMGANGRQKTFDKPIYSFTVIYTGDKKRREQFLSFFLSHGNHTAFIFVHNGVEYYVLFPQSIEVIDKIEANRIVGFETEVELIGIRHKVHEDESTEEIEEEPVHPGGVPLIVEHDGTDYRAYYSLKDYQVHILGETDEIHYWYKKMDLVNDSANYYESVVPSNLNDDYIMDVEISTDNQLYYIYQNGGWFRYQIGKEYKQKKVSEGNSFTLNLKKLDDTDIISTFNYVKYDGIKVVDKEEITQGRNLELYKGGNFVRTLLTQLDLRECCEEVYETYLADSRCDYVSASANVSQANVDRKGNVSLVVGAHLTVANELPYRVVFRAFTAKTEQMTEDEWIYLNDAYQVGGSVASDPPHYRTIGFEEYPVDMKKAVIGKINVYWLILDNGTNKTKILLNVTSDYDSDLNNYYMWRTKTITSEETGETEEVIDETWTYAMEDMGDSAFVPAEALYAIYSSSVYDGYISYIKTIAYNHLSDLAPVGYEITDPFEITYENSVFREFNSSSRWHWEWFHGKQVKYLEHGQHADRTFDPENPMNNHPGRWIEQDISFLMGLPAEGVHPDAPRIIDGRGSCRISTEGINPYPARKEFSNYRFPIQDDAYLQYFAFEALNKQLVNVSTGGYVLFKDGHYMRQHEDYGSDLGEYRSELPYTIRGAIKVRDNPLTFLLAIEDVGWTSQLYIYVKGKDSESDYAQWLVIKFDDDEYPDEDTCVLNQRLRVMNYNALKRFAEEVGGEIE